MKDSLAVGLSVAAFAVGCATVAVIEADRVNKIDSKFNYIAKGINYVQENVDLTVPEEVAEELTRKAAEKVANDAVVKAAEKATKEVNANIQSTVKKIVNDAYADVKTKVADKLEKEINVKTIERIEQQVAGKVAKQIMNNYIPTTSFGASKADIAKACIESGMDSYDISKVMASIK